MDIESLHKRKAQLQDDQRRLLVQRDQLTANLNAYDGAIQELDFWIHALEGVQEEPDQQEGQEGQEKSAGGQGEDPASSSSPLPFPADREGA